VTDPERTRWPGPGARAAATLTLASATIRYPRSVRANVRAQLERWEEAARQIPDPQLRESALGKLAEERLNAAGAAMLALSAPPARRAGVVRAIIALQVLYDHLDALSETQAPAGPEHGAALYLPFTDAVDVDADGERKQPPGAGGQAAGEREAASRDTGADDGGYSRRLSDCVRGELAALPATGALTGTLAGTAKRCAQAQLHTHAIPLHGSGQAREWAQPLAAADGLGWREELAGAAASVIALHALIALAAHEQASSAHGEQLARAYLSISAATSLLDTLADRSEDITSHTQGGFANLYESEQELAGALAAVVKDAAAHTGNAPDASFHLMILAGIIGYYTSTIPSSETAHTAIRPLTESLWPLVGISIGVWRRWRAAERPRS